MSNQVWVNNRLPYMASTGLTIYNKDNSVQVLESQQTQNVTFSGTGSSYDNVNFTFDGTICTINETGIYYFNADIVFLVSDAVEDMIIGCNFIEFNSETTYSWSINRYPIKGPLGSSPGRINLQCCLYLEKDQMIGVQVANFADEDLSLQQPCKLLIQRLQ